MRVLCCSAATNGCRELWECWCGSPFMTLLWWATLWLAVLELQWTHKEDINFNQPQNLLAQTLKHKMKCSECVTESTRVKCCHYLAAVSGGVLAAQLFLLVTTLSLFSVCLTDASFQSCLITFRGECFALLFVTICYALQSCGKSPTWSERLLTLGHETLHFKEAGEIPSVAASWVLSVPCSQPNSLDKALPLPCCSFLPFFFFQRDGTPDPVPRLADWLTPLTWWPIGSPVRWPWHLWRSRRVRLIWRSVAASVATLSPMLTQISSSWRWPPWCTQAWWSRSQTVMTNVSSCSPVSATGSVPVSPVSLMGPREAWQQGGRTQQSWTAHQSARSLSEERKTVCAKLDKSSCQPCWEKKENWSFAPGVEMALDDPMSLWECSPDLFSLPVCDCCW